MGEKKKTGDRMMKNMEEEVVVLMYSFGLACVIKKILLSICYLSVHFISDKPGQPLQQTSVVLENQDLLD